MATPVDHLKGRQTAYAGKNIAFFRCTPIFMSSRSWRGQHYGAPLIVVGRASGEGGRWSMVRLGLSISYFFCWIRSVLCACLGSFEGSGRGTTSGQKSSNGLFWGSCRYKPWVPIPRDCCLFHLLVYGLLLWVELCLFLSHFGSGLWFLFSVFRFFLLSFVF